MDWILDPKQFSVLGIRNFGFTIPQAKISTPEFRAPKSFCLGFRLLIIQIIFPLFFVFTFFGCFAKCAIGPNILLPITTIIIYLIGGSLLSTSQT